jgi:hypothetical protein
MLDLSSFSKALSAVGAAIALLFFLGIDLPS